MKRLLAALLVTIFLMACGNARNTPVVLPNEQEDADISKVALQEDNIPEMILGPLESNHIPNPADNRPSDERSEDRYSFILPEKVETSCAQTAIQLVTDFGGRFVFPEFYDVSTMDLFSDTVSYNLFLLTGSMSKDMEISNLVLASDMTYTGQRFFGEQFNFPPGLSCYSIGPASQDPMYYTITNWPGTGVPIYYLLLDMKKDADEVIATFLPFSTRLSWQMDDNGVFRTLGVYFFDPNDITFYFVDIEYPDGFEAYDVSDFLYGYRASSPLCLRPPSQAVQPLGTPMHGRNIS